MESDERMRLISELNLLFSFDIKKERREEIQKLLKKEYEHVKQSSSKFNKKTGKK
jgi:hypothetical protein